MNACVYRVCFSVVSSCDTTPFTTCCIQLMYLGDQIRADVRATPEGISIEGSVNGLERKHHKDYPACATSALWTGTQLAPPTLNGQGKDDKDIDIVLREFTVLWEGQLCGGM